MERARDCTASLETAVYVDDMAAAHAFYCRLSSALREWWPGTGSTLTTPVPARRSWSFRRGHTGR